MFVPFLLSLLAPVVMCGPTPLHSLWAGRAVEGGAGAPVPTGEPVGFVARDEPAGTTLLRIAAQVRTGRADKALARLREMADETAKDPWLKEVAAVLETRALLEAGRFSEALEASAARPGRDHPTLRVLQRWYVARAYLGLGKHEEADRLFRKLSGDDLGRHLDPELSLTALDNAVSGKLERAARHWLSRVSSSKSVEESRRLSARVSAWKLMGRPIDETCRRLFTRFPCAPLPAECGELKPDSLPQAERFERAEKLFSCWGYAEAAAEFEAFLASPAMTKLHNRSRFYLAEIHARKLRDDRAAALKHYEHVVQNGGGSRSYALYQVGRCLMNLERYDEALRIFEQYVARYPRGEFAEDCYYYFGWLPYDHDKLEEALPGFERYLSRYSSGSKRTYILWFKAWSLYRLGRLSEAVPVLTRLSSFGNDIVAGKALYWIGRIHEQNGKTKEAIDAFAKVLKRYPLSYYGASSWRRLAALGDQREYPLFEVPPASVPVPSPEAWKDHVEKEREKEILPVLDAVFLGETVLARRLFGTLDGEFERRKGEDGARAYHWIHSLLEEPDRIREWGQSHFRQRGSTPSRHGRLGWMLEFPRAYQLLIEQEGMEQRLPPWFLYSIMRQESRYRRGVVSWADAVGLLQIIPQTASRTAQMLSIPFVRADMVRPEVNIRLGAGYLGALASDFGRQLILVAASYNAGPNAIRDFLARNKDRDLDFMIEEIAYNEARNYCRKVTGHVLKYLAVYADDTTRRQVFDMLFPPRVDFAPGSAVPF